MIVYSTRAANGGLIDIMELRNRLVRLRGNAVKQVPCAYWYRCVCLAAAAYTRRITRQDIGPDDIRQAVKCLKILGSGFKMITLKERTLVIAWEGNGAHDTSTLSLFLCHCLLTYAHALYPAIRKLYQIH